MHFYNEVVQ